jgi:hypothetical protein
MAVEFLALQERLMLPDVGAERLAGPEPDDPEPDDLQWAVVKRLPGLSGTRKLGESALCRPVEVPSAEQSSVVAVLEREQWATVLQAIRQPVRVAQMVL